MDVFSFMEACPTEQPWFDVWKFRDRDVPDWDAYEVPCREACPAHMDVPRYIKLVAQGKYDEALAVVREKAPFPAVLGRVCLQPCEDACSRSKLNSEKLVEGRKKEEPVCIRFLKRAASDNGNGLWKQNSKVSPATGKKVAVVGSGPAGLTAAYYLAKKGHSVTVFEALSKTGGMMQAVIPAYRLPDEILDSEIKEIKDVGIEIKTNSRIEKSDDLFKQGYSAAFIATGAWRSLKLGVPGEDAKGAIYALDFLQQVKMGQKVDLGEKVVVIGGGNAAIDAARSSIRLGAKEVNLICLECRIPESKDKMVAQDSEVEEAENEGVTINPCMGVKNFITKDGKITGLETIPCVSVRNEDGTFAPKYKEGPSPDFQADSVIVAIGQSVDRSILPAGSIDTGTMQTSDQRVFAGGDVVTGPSSVIDAIAQGRIAAASIDKYLNGDGNIEETLVPMEEPETWFERNEDLVTYDEDFIIHQVKMPCIGIKERSSDFKEVELGFNKDEATEEASRCFKCNLRPEVAYEEECAHCGVCFMDCPKRAIDVTYPVSFC
jgi:NADPH-dependent glutamate synthase beta subunit-like oxidoreductase